MVRLQAWAAPMVGGGLRLTAATPGADLSLRRLLRQPLLVGGALLLQGRRCPQSRPHNRAGHACQQVQSGLVTMDRIRRLICLGHETPDAGGAMVGTMKWAQLASSLSCMAEFTYGDSLTQCSPDVSIDQGTLSRNTGLQPRVGIWISGILSLQDSHLWAAGMEYLLSRAGIEKALQPDMAFLIVIFTPGTRLPHPLSAHSVNRAYHEV